MTFGKRQRGGGKKVSRKDRAAEIANILAELITTFALVLVVRAFVMEAFRIPTGSMADTLKGAHFRLRCPQCGYQYDYGFVPERYGFPSDYIPQNRNLRVYPSRCPSCGYYQPTGGRMPVANGDRILVLKDGIIVEKGEADMIYQSPESDYTKELLLSIPD